jgi:hypothetical protein
MLWRVPTTYLTTLSSIELIWCSGKNCWVIGTCHIIVNFQQEADRFDSIVDDDVESANTW